MTALTPEALTTEEIVELALKQVAAFNSGDWEQLGAGLAPDSRYDEFGTQRKIEGPEKIVELFKGWKTAFPDAAGTVTSAVGSGSMAVYTTTHMRAKLCATCSTGRFMFPPARVWRDWEAGSAAPRPALALRWR